MYEFDAWYGDIRRRVRVSLYFPGKERNSYNVNVAGFYRGMLMKTRGEWLWYPPKPDQCDITTDDLQILQEIIDGQLEGVVHKKSPGA